jgi:hypothetical protein
MRKLRSLTIFYCRLGSRATTSKVKLRALSPDSADSRQLRHGVGAAACGAPVLVAMASLGYHRHLPGPLPKPGHQPAAGPEPAAQQTETVQPGVPCSLRANAKAFSAGIRRSFLTGLPRRPRCSMARGVEPSFRVPG